MLPIVEGVMVMLIAGSQSAGAQAMDAAEQSALLDAARVPVSEALGKPPLLVVRQLNRDGDWAFLFADMQQRPGVPYDYSGTPKSEAARHGAVSRSYAALLRKGDEGWRVVECVIGPTDIAWEGWAAKYQLPASLFAFDQQVP